MVANLSRMIILKLIEAFSSEKERFMSDEIAKRLSEMRREHGYSQEALANELGISRQAISKWERGESQPDSSNLIALADLYGVTLDELVRPNVAERTKDEKPESTEESEEPKKAADVEYPPPRTAPIYPNPIPVSAKPRNPLKSFPYPVLVAIIYLVGGLVFGIWHPTWLIFLTIPFYYWIVKVLYDDPKYAKIPSVDNSASSSQM